MATARQASTRWVRIWNKAGVVKATVRCGGKGVNDGFSLLARYKGRKARSCPLGRDLAVTPNSPDHGPRAAWS